MLLKGRCERRKANRNESLICFAYLSRTQRQLQLPMLPGNLWRDGKSLSNQQCCTHLSRALEALHSLLQQPGRVRPHRLTPSTCKSRSPGRGKMSCPRALKLQEGLFGRLCPIFHAASRRNRELSWEEPRLGLSTAPCEHLHTSV